MCACNSKESLQPTIKARTKQRLWTLIRKWIKFPDEADQKRKRQETPAFSTSSRNSLGQSPFIRTVLFCKRIQLQFVKKAAYSCTSGGGGCLCLKKGHWKRLPAASWSRRCPLWAVLSLNMSQRRDISFSGHSVVPSYVACLSNHPGSEMLPAGTVMYFMYVDVAET